MFCLFFIFRASKGIAKQTRSQYRKKKKAAHFGGKAGTNVFHTKEIKDAWDEKKTLQQNFTKLGLTLNPNANIKARQAKIKVVPVEELRSGPAGALHAKLDEMNEQTNTPKSYVPKSMSINEQRILLKLIRKHQDDYKAMARDIKINVKQQTEAQLAKRIALMRHLQAL